jgi:hypothetical protein
MSRLVEELMSMSRLVVAPLWGRPVAAGRKLKSMIHLNYAKQTQSVKKNAGQVSYIKIDITSTYQWIMKKFCIGHLVKTNPIYPQGNKANLFRQNDMPDLRQIRQFCRVPDRFKANFCIISDADIL